MSINKTDKDRYDRYEKFVDSLRKNEVLIPNEFTVEMGKLIKKAREENGLNQSQLAEKLSRRQATISDLENGKIEIGIFTLLTLAIELKKPISYFIPETTFLASLNDVHNKYEEEALSLFRSLEYEGDSNLALKFMKLLIEDYREQQNNEFTKTEEE